MLNAIMKMLAVCMVSWAMMYAVPQQRAVHMLSATRAHAFRYPCTCFPLPVHMLSVTRAHAFRYSRTCFPLLTMCMAYLVARAFRCVP